MHVLYDIRLSDDILWSIPIILDIDLDEIAGLREGG